MTKIDICNAGLSEHLGASRITSLDQNNPEARACKEHYDRCLTSLLESHQWHFANGRQLLAPLTNDRPEWAFKYQKPTSALKILWVNEPNAARLLLSRNEHPDTEREFGDGAIYSDTAGAACAFTKKIDDASIYPQAFKDVLSAMVAAACALPVTKDTKLKRGAQLAVRDLWDVAVVQDEENTPPQGYEIVPEYMKVRGIT